MNVVTSMFQQTWLLTMEMAPYLLFGFLMAGVLRAFFTESWVRQHLGRKGFYQICKSVVIGIPLPLCSCGVIPVAAGIRRSGGQRGAVAAFTASTPQTGIDSIAATVGMLGWTFTAIRLVIAFANGLVAGLVVERWGGKDEDPAGQSCCSSGQNSESGTHSCCAEPDHGKPCCSGEQEESNGAERAHAFGKKLASGMRFGLVTLPRDLAPALILGLLIAGAISAFVPTEFFRDFPGGLVGSYVALTLISLPLYVCSTGSIPMAFSFLQAGLSPGAVIIFLIAGPASNVATVTSLWRLIGARGTVGYIFSIVLTSWICAFVVDLTGMAMLINQAVDHHDMGIGPLQQVAGGLLVFLLGWAGLGSRLAKKES